MSLGAIKCKGDDWDNKMTQIWPIQQSVVQWPPKVTITNGGPNGIAYLLDRWRLN